MSYTWHHKDDETYIFNIDGSYKRANAKPLEQKATLSIKGKTIS